MITAKLLRTAMPTEDTIFKNTVKEISSHMLELAKLGGNKYSYYLLPQANFDKLKIRIAKILIKLGYEVQYSTDFGSHYIEISW